MRKHWKLRPEERDRIAILKAKGFSVRAIAKELDRSPSTISDEIKKNGGLKCEYVSIYAQCSADERKENSYKRPVLKNRRVRHYVMEKLVDGWSPEQISGRIKLDYADNEGMRISHEAIYQFIYDSKWKHLRMWEYLPWKRKHRRKKHGRNVQRCHIPDRISIHERRMEINDRTEFGHWEGDTVEGRRKKAGLHTEVERVSRKLFARKIDGVNGEDTVSAQLGIFSSLPPKARGSTTLDNGKENHLHTGLRARLGMDTYFCDPYSSWQKGTNEFHNGLLRRYFPKRTDFTYVEQEEINEIVEELNNRPRKVLQFLTPNEVFNMHLLSVRIQS